LNLIQRFFAEIPVLQHLSLGLHGYLTDRGDVGVVQTVCRTDRELHLVHAHVQELLQPGVFLVHFLWLFIELDLAVVVVHEDVEMMAKNGRSLKQCIVRCDPAVRPDLQNQLVVVGTLADAGIFDAVLDTDYWRKNRINRNNSERHIRALVFVSSEKSTATRTSNSASNFCCLSTVQIIWLVFSTSIPWIV